MLIFKLALRNAIRLPKRTLLYCLLILLTVASFTVGILIYGATEKALDNLDENYTFVASLIPTTDRTSPGSALCISEFQKICDATEYEAYNITLYQDSLYIPDEKLLFEITDNMPGDSEYPELFSVKMGCSVIATNNLCLERGFFEGKRELVAGSDFSADAYSGNAREIIIAKWMADKYSISIGSEICYGIEKSKANNVVLGTQYIKAKVVGIYLDTENPYVKTVNNAYVPVMSFFRYGLIYQSIAGDYDMPISRADFVLPGRDSITVFTDACIASGLDLRICDIIFNNAEYDMIKEGLVNVRTVVVLLVAVVSVAGLGILITFASYFTMTRRKEKTVLRSMGMKRSGIALMFAVEFLLAAVIAAPLGYAGGRIISDTVCRYVDKTVEQDSVNAALFAENDGMPDGLKPLVCRVKMSISDGTMEPTGTGIVPYYPEERRDGDAAIKLWKIFDTNAETFAEIATSVFTPVTLAVTEDLSAWKLEDHYRELIDNETLKSFDLPAYVSRESGLSPGDRLYYIANELKSDFTSYPYLRQPILMYVAGYYEENGIISGTDVLTVYETYTNYSDRFLIYYLPHCDAVYHTGEK